MKRIAYILLIYCVLLLPSFSLHARGITQEEIINNLQQATQNLENAIQSICPPNSYLKNGLCYCNEGLVWNERGTECITYNQACQNKYGSHTYGDKNYCYCTEEYVWNDKKTTCISIDQYCQDKLGPNAYGDETLQCHCKNGYALDAKGIKCITYTEACQETYGEHVIGRKGDKKDIAFCDCGEGYVWNLSKSQCIPKFKALVEYFTHFNLLAFILGLIPILIWFLVIKLITKFVFKTKLSIKKSLIFFGVGMVITFFVWFLENYFITLLHIDINATLPFSVSVFVYLGIAGIEELSKFFSAVLVLGKNKHFDEAIDAMIYLIVLALGFAVVENYLIAYQEFVSSGRLLPTFQIITLRFIGANLLHALSSGIIGFFWALSLIKSKKKYLFYGLSLGILLHWVFNIAIINLGGDAVFLITLVLTILLVIFFFTIKKFLSKFNFHRFQ